MFNSQLLILENPNDPFGCFPVFSAIFVLAAFLFFCYVLYASLKDGKAWFGLVQAQRSKTPVMYWITIGFYIAVICFTSFHGLRFIRATFVK